MTSSTAAAIAALNDQFRRQGPARVPGMRIATAGIAALPPAVQATAWCRVAAFSAFTADNDPYGEHDFGALDVAGVGKLFWKIDYYATAQLDAGAEDPADPSASFRVLILMLASEY